MATYIGIDPGFRNLGYAELSINDSGVTIKETAYFDPKTFGFINTIDTIGLKTSADLASVTMERYVAYKGIHNPVSEEILMIIGGLRYAYNFVPVHLFRAIEWKPKLCKYLVKQYNFDNPSKTFDKKYSIAAAERIVGSKVESDHIADAICLAYIGYLTDARIIA